MSLQREFLSPTAWLTALLDPAVTLRFASYGYATQAAAWGYTDRRVPEHLVYLVIDESLAAEVDGRSWLLGPGGFCLLPPGLLHTFAHADRKRPVSLHFFRVELRRGDRVLHLDHGPIVLEATHRLLALFEPLRDDRASTNDDALVRVRATLAFGLSTALRKAAQATPRGRQLSPAQRRQLYELMAEHPGARFTPAQLAERANLSLDHFTRLFRRSFGTSPREWLVAQRIDYARNLLAESTMTISEVADELQYPDLYQFSRQFKKVTGVSPSTYRQSLP